MQFINPTNDYAFKRIFGNEKHPQVLISFLNAVLDFPPKTKSGAGGNPKPLSSPQDRSPQRNRA